MSSVKSGNWSDAATWGGRIPGAADTPSVSAGHTIVFDSASSTVSGLNINAAGIFKFDPTRSTSLKSTRNIIVQGTLQMRPNNASVIQYIQFLNIDESKFVGGGMDPLDSDVGLWVMGAGQLDIYGTSKTSWTKASASINAGSSSLTLEATPTAWLAGDEITITPTEARTTGAASTDGFDTTTIKSIAGATIALNAATTRAHPKVNGTWAAEVINLTRNVRIEGTATGKSHIFIRSTKPQTVNYAALRYMGPRKDRSGDKIKELIAGRYGLHFHHAENGSRGSVVLGTVIRDTDSHSFVPHVSHGVSLKENVAFNVLETAFWWDPGDATHDISYDHNIVARCRFVEASLDMNAEDAPTFSSSGFALNTGDGNSCTNNVVVERLETKEAEVLITGNPSSTKAYGFSTETRHTTTITV